MAYAHKRKVKAFRRKERAEKRTLAPTHKEIYSWEKVGNTFRPTEHLVTLRGGASSPKRWIKNSFGKPAQVNYSPPKWMLWKVVREVKKDTQKATKK